MNHHFQHYLSKPKDMLNWTHHQAFPHELSQTGKKKIIEKLFCTKKSGLIGIFLCCHIELNKLSQIKQNYISITK